MYDINAFQRDLLWVLAGEGELHGLGIKDRIDDYYEEEIHHGRIYPSLDTLVDMGLIHKDSLDGRTNSYRLTTRGRKELEARREWENKQVYDSDEVAIQDVDGTMVK